MDREHVGLYMVAHRGSPLAAFTLIHKFRTEKGEAHPVLSERRDIIVITDEAHLVANTTRWP